jgi:hypothetical protein
MPLPIGVEAPDQKPEKAVPGLEVGTRTGTERDMQLGRKSRLSTTRSRRSRKSLASMGRRRLISFSIVTGSPISPE